MVKVGQRLGNKMEFAQQFGALALVAFWSDAQRKCKLQKWNQVLIQGKIND